MTTKENANLEGETENKGKDLAMEDLKRLIQNYFEYDGRNSNFDVNDLIFF